MIDGDALREARELANPLPAWPLIRRVNELERLLRLRAPAELTQATRLQWGQLSKSLHETLVMVAYGYTNGAASLAFSLQLRPDDVEVAVRTGGYRDA